MIPLGTAAMFDQATKSTTIEAPPQSCFEVVCDYESYPEWAPEIKKAEVLRRDTDGRGGLVSFQAAAMGRSTTYLLEYFYGSNPLRVSWRLVQGDLTKRLDGEYSFHPVVDEPDRTEVTYHLAVQMSMPLPGFVKRRAEARIMSTALEVLRSRVESRPT